MDGEPPAAPLLRIAITHPDGTWGRASAPAQPDPAEHTAQEDLPAEQLPGLRDRKFLVAEMMLDVPHLMELCSGPGPWVASLPLGADRRDAPAPGPVPVPAVSRLAVERVSKPAGAADALHLLLTPSRPASLEELFVQFRALMSLMAFTQLEGTPEITFRARMDPPSEASGDAHWITCTAPGTRLGRAQEGSLRGGHPLFTGGDLPLQALVDAWGMTWREHQTSVEMLLAGVALSQEYPEAAMLILLGSAEALHATSTDLSRRELKDSTLRRKLEHLAQRVRFDDVMLAHVPAGVWATQSVKLRSSFTHSGRVDSCGPGELRILMQLTIAVVVLALLRELGIPSGDEGRRLAGLPLLRSVVDSPRQDAPGPRVGPVARSSG